MLQEHGLQCPIRIVTIVDEQQIAAEHARQPIDRYLDVHNHWPRLSGVCENGAVLVRPDGHVLWRCTDAIDLIPSCGHVQSDASARSGSDGASTVSKTPSDDAFLTLALWHVTNSVKAAVQPCMVNLQIRSNGSVE